MAHLIRLLEGDADIVLFDTPPVLAVTDAVILSRLVDGALLLVDVGHTKRPAAKQAAETLKQVDANVLGVILNRASSADGSYYSYDYYAEDRGKQEWPVLEMIRRWYSSRRPVSGIRLQSVSQPQSSVPNGHNGSGQNGALATSRSNGETEMIARSD